MKKLHLIITISLVSLVAIFTLLFIFKPETDNSMKKENKFANNQEKFNYYKSAPEVMSADELKNKTVTIKTEKGDIEIQLFEEDAPVAVSNFITLANDGFYDGIIFHRREEGFVIQGGDPLGKGYGGPGYQFEDEPVMREYTRGIVAMANAGPDTNGSQFFIMLDDVPLPPSYTIFGEVTKGMDVVDKIEIGDKMVEVVVE
jgi:cyclophilin family peptidyl-prolyl cis-trans isomerase